MCANQSRFFRQWRRFEFLLILLAAVGPNLTDGHAPDLRDAVEQNRNDLRLIQSLLQFRP
jgi:hypothetical protein